MLEKSKKKSKVNGRISTLLTIIGVLVFVFSGYKLITLGWVYYHNHQILSEVQKVYVQHEPVVEEVLEELEIGRIRSQFIELQEINEDIIGWISIDGTKVNYPILQASDNAFYLTHNYEKEYTTAGSIFMDYRNNLETDNPNTIVYGHRMRDNSMFNSLKDFLEEDFFNDHGTISFDTMYESYEAEVFAAYSTTTDFDYIQTNFELGTDYLTLVHQMKQQSKFDKDIEIGMDDQIITLSTCDYLLDPNKGRLVVHAKLTKRN